MKNTFQKVGTFPLAIFATSPLGNLLGGKFSSLELFHTSLKVQSRGVKEHLGTFIPLSIVMLQ